MSYSLDCWLRMVKLENAEFLIKLQLFVASFLLVSGFCLSLFSTTSKLKDCDGAGADILLLIDAAHTRRYGKMNLYSKALMERFFVNTKKQECRFKMVEYQSYPLEAVDMGFLNGDFEDNNVDIKKKTTSKNLKFLVIFTAREEVYNEETQAVIDRVAALNVITVVVAFNYPHKAGAVEWFTEVPIEDLEEIASDNFYIFVAEHMHANNLISSIVNVICREVKAETLFNRDHKNKFDVLYDCGESNPCYFKLLNQNLHSFPYSNPRKFVECEDIGRCAIGECVYGHFWDELTRTCH